MDLNHKLFDTINQLGNAYLLSLQEALMKFRKIAPGIYHVFFETIKDMNNALLRFQEYYESPKFRNTVFTLAEFRKWYKKEYGDFSYYTDWDGLNFPSRVLWPFKFGRFGRLSKEERNFIKEIENKVEEMDFYIIATARNSDPGTYTHEFMHAMYEMRAGYRWRVRLALFSLGFKLLPIFKWLKNNKYDRSVYLDETQAMLVCDQWELKAQAKINLNRYKYVINYIRKLFERYRKNDVGLD